MPSEACKQGVANVTPNRVLTLFDIELKENKVE